MMSVWFKMWELKIDGFIKNKIIGVLHLPIYPLHYVL